MRCVNVANALRVINIFITILNFSFIFFFNWLKRWFLCWIEINLSKLIFKTSTYATKLFTFCDWFCFVVSCFYITTKHWSCKFFIKSIRKFEKFFYFHVFYIIFKFFFVISALRQRVASKLLNLADLNSFRKKV